MNHRQENTNAMVRVMTQGGIDMRILIERHDRAQARVIRLEMAFQEILSMSVVPDKDSWHSGIVRIARTALGLPQ